MKPPKPHPSLTHADLVRLLSYDPATGLFTWLVSPNFNVQAGQQAGSINGNGYRSIKIRGVNVRAGRLAWFYVHGTWPTAEIDHRNRDRADDRIDNLRPASRSDNNRNRVFPRADGMTGLAGVSKRGDKWRAAISIGGKIKHLGTHETPEAARVAYLAARQQHCGGA